jgi:hypothetical protein
MLRKAIEQGLLVQAFLHPLRFEAQIGLALGFYVQPVFLAKAFHRLAKHPGEGNHRGGIGRVTQGGGLEVAMARFRATVVGMIGLADVLEGCHETDALDDARGPLRLRQIPDALSRD